MSRFDERLERDLRHIADKATPSSTAWEAIQTRVAEQADHPELEITMLKPNPEPDRHIRTWILGAAAAVLLVVGGLYVALSDGDDTSLRTTDADTADTPTPSTTEAPTPSTSEAPTTTLAPEVSADALATIEEFLGSTDMATLSTIVTESAIAASTNSAIMADADEWLVALQVLGLEAEVLSCVEAGAETSIRCQVSLRSNITEAFGQEPRVRGVTFDFTEGLISTWPAVVAGSDFDELREAAADAGFGEETAALCPSLTADCAEFVMTNLDAWAAAAIGADT